MRKGKIEFRWGKDNKKYELIMWHEGDETCHVIAFFEETNEGYDMLTVGNRFFENADAWIVGKHAMSFLDEIFAAHIGEEE
jgi:hypothetical protein